MKHTMTIFMMEENGHHVYQPDGLEWLDGHFHCWVAGMQFTTGYA